MVLAGTAAAALWRAWLVYVQHDPPPADAPMLVVLRAGVPLLVEGALVLLAGKTIGELVVDLRTVPPSVSRRLVKLVVGVVPLVTLAVVDTTVAQLAVGLLAVVGRLGRLPDPRSSRHRQRPAGLALEIDDS